MAKLFQITSDARTKREQLEESVCVLISKLSNNKPVDMIAAVLANHIVDQTLLIDDLKNEIINLSAAVTIYRKLVDDARTVSKRRK